MVLNYEVGNFNCSLVLLSEKDVFSFSSFSIDPVVFAFEIRQAGEPFSKARAQIVFKFRITSSAYPWKF